MVSINKEATLRRASLVNDMSYSAQALPKDIDKHTKALRRSVGSQSAGSGSQSDFLRSVGSM